MSIADISNASALPAEARMGLKPNALPAKRTRINVQPYQRPTGSITTNQLIQFYLPARKGCMYDPQTMYVRGTIGGVKTNSDGTNGGTLNRNAFSVINRHQVYGQDTVLLEDIQNYNDLIHILTDMQMSREDKYSMSTMFGGNPATTNLTYTANTTADAFATIPSANTTAGTVFTTLTVSNATDNGRVFVDETDTLNFCIPVMSAFGLLADTLIPVGWLSSDLRFDFYTETPAVAFRNTTGGGTNGSSYTLTNLELVVDYIEFEGVSLEAVYQYAPPSGPVYCHGSTYKCYTDSITTGTDGFYTHILPHRSLSVKQVLSATHLSTIANGGDAFGRVFPYGADGSLSAGLSIGGQKWPQKPITTVAEAFTELQKSQHSFNSLLMNGSISSTEYAKWLNTTTNSSADKAVLGFDTEIYDKKGSTIVNGQNWTGLNVFLEGEVGLSTGAALSAPLNRNTFVLFDVIYVYSDGVLSVRF